MVGTSRKISTNSVISVAARRSLPPRHCNGNDDAPDDHFNKRPTDLKTQKYDETNEAYMDAYLERSPHIQLVVRSLIRCAHALTPQVNTIAVVLRCQKQAGQD